MVDAPKLTPQVQTTRTTQIPTLRDADLPNFRGGTQVDTSGIARAANALGAQAGIFKQNAKVFGVSLDTALEELRKQQQMEAEKLYAQDYLVAQQAVHQAKLNAPSSKDVVPYVTEAYDRIAEQSLSNTSLTPFQRDYMGQRWTAQKANELTAAFSTSVVRQEEEFRYNANKVSEGRAMAVFNDPSAFEQQIAEGSLSIMALPGMNDTAKKAYIDTQNEALADAAARGLIETNPRAALAELRSGRFDAYIDADRKAQLLDAADAKIEEAKVSLTPEQIETEVDLKTRLERDPHSVSDDEIYKVAEQNNWSDTAIINTMLARERNIDRLRAKVKDLSIVSNAIDGDVLLDQKNDKHREAVDAYYLENTAKAAANAPDVNTRNNIIANFIKSAGIVPDAVKSEIRAALANGNPEQAAAAIDLIQKAEQRDDGTLLDIGIDSEYQALVDQMQGALLVSQDPEKTIAEIRQLNRVNPESVRARKDFFEQEFNGETAQQKAEDKIDTFFGLQASALSVGGAAARLRADMKDLAMDYFVRNPDMDKALDYAEKKLREIGWRTTEVGAERRLMKYAPEFVYKADTDSINKDLIREVRTLEPNAELKNVYIISDPLTAREWRSGRPVGYQVLVVDENGLERVLTDENGTVQRYYPNTERLTQERHKKAVKSLKNIRRVRNDVLDIEINPEKSFPYNIPDMIEEMQ